MKHHMTIRAALGLAASLLAFTLHAQTSVPSGTDVPRILSYQGQVMTSDGKAISGMHHITTTLYSDHFGTHSIWQGEYNAEVTNGIFTVLLGSGKSPLPDVTELNRSLWVGIKVDGGTEMRPLSQLSAAPYAINIPDRSITLPKLAADVQSAIFGLGHTPTIQAVAWSQGGDALTNDDWIGSSTNYALEVHVYNNDAVNNTGSGRVMRWEPNSTSANLIGGYKSNSIFTGVYGSTICGGGSNGNINEIRSPFSVIAGGKSNLIDSLSPNSVIIGGSSNTIGQGITGGYIGAGAGCFIHNNATHSAILGGGSNDVAANCEYGFIGGGGTNHITTGGTTNGGKNCTVPGGDHLSAQSYAQTVIGHYNSSQGTSTPSVINGNDRLFIIGNGTSTAASNAFEVSDNGHSIVSHTNGGSNAAITGGTYKDNIIYGWGYWENGIGGGSLASSFGVSVVNSALGVYDVTMNLVKPDGTSTCLNNLDAAVTVTPYNQTCYIPSVTALTNNGNTSTTFTIRIYQQNINPPSLPGHPDYWLSCDPVSSDFMFMVVGRPH